MMAERLLPTTLDRATVQAALDARAPWFYAFRFANGAETAVDDAAVAAVHATRAAAIWPHLDRLFPDWSAVRALDIACHEGWWALQTAARGARVDGMDIRPEHIDKARWLAEVSGAAAFFRTCDLFNAERAAPYDLVWFVGILYHLEDPMRALRLVRALTGDVCVIEGQVARPQSLTTARAVSFDRSGPGIAVLPAEATHAHAPEGIVMVPTLDALRLMLAAAGFRAVHVVLPPPDAYASYAAMDRVILFAYV